MPNSSKSSFRRGFGIAALLAASLIALAGVMYWLEAADDEVERLALNLDDPSQSQVGALIYRGGLDIPRMGQNIGGLSALRWDPQSGRLLALTDDARWVWLSLTEESAELVGLESVETGPLLGLEGEGLGGKEKGDSESLTRSADGGWLIGFERDHRVWRYPTLGARPAPTKVDPVALMGAMEPNGGTETLAGDESALLLCAERFSPEPTPNCFWTMQDGEAASFRLNAPGDMSGLGAVATDADRTSDGSVFVLFRSYDPSTGNTAGIVALRSDDNAQEIATLRPPLSVDNFEGLAVREEGGRTFLYLVSDDNFSSNQRTLLMKFEVSESPTN